MALIDSVIVGDNADLMRAAAELYIELGDVVVDATYGRGTFWRRLPGLPVIAHDLHRGDGVDLRALPEADGTVDVLVRDPPYRPEESSPLEAAPIFADRFGLEDSGLEHLDDVLALYVAGIAEARRVLRRRGRLFVKLQDSIHGRGLYPMLHDVTEAARAAGFETLDVLVLYYGRNAGPGSGRWARQQRARRSHSYLVVFSSSRYWERRDSRSPIPATDLELALDFSEGAP